MQGNCCDINWWNIKAASCCGSIDRGIGRIKEEEIKRLVTIAEQSELLLVWAIMSVGGAFDGAGGAARLLRIDGFKSLLTSSTISSLLFFVCLILSISFHFVKYLLSCSGVL